jgi:hypothetical protein
MIRVLAVMFEFWQQVFSDDRDESLFGTDAREGFTQRILAKNEALRRCYARCILALIAQRHVG